MTEVVAGDSNEAFGMEIVAARSRVLPAVIATAQAATSAKDRLVEFIR
jgi:hypothetical protein